MNCPTCFYGPHCACSKPRATVGNLERGNCPDEDQSEELYRLHKLAVDCGCDDLADDLKAGHIDAEEMAAWERNMERRTA